MKIIKGDIYDREGPGHDDELIREGVDEKTGQWFVDKLNHYDNDNPVKWYTLVDDFYKLKKFEP